MELNELTTGQYLGILRDVDGSGQIVIRTFKGQEPMDALHDVMDALKQERAMEVQARKPKVTFRYLFEVLADSHIVKVRDLANTVLDANKEHGDRVQAVCDLEGHYIMTTWIIRAAMMVRDKGIMPITVAVMDGDGYPVPELDKGYLPLSVPTMLMQVWDPEAIIKDVEAA